MLSLTPIRISLLALALSISAFATNVPPSTTDAAAKPQTKKTTTTTHKSTHTSTTHSTTHKSTSRKTAASRGKKTTRASKKRGQQAIAPDRARAIQEALIREHYLTGEPSGSWDSTTQAAMQKYQADQGWQSKTTPDSRALIKLGLGPSNDHLLNPESAMTSAPPSSPNAVKPLPAPDAAPHQ